MDTHTQQGEGVESRPLSYTSGGSWTLPHVYSQGMTVCVVLMPISGRLNVNINTAVHALWGRSGAVG